MTPNKLSEEQRRALQEHPGVAVPLVDEAANVEAWLVPDATYQKVRSLLEGDSFDARGVYAAQDEVARHAGWDDPALDVRIRAAQSLIVISKPVAADRHQDISRDVYTASQKNPRYSEGSIIVLGNGSLLYATTEFIGGGSDFSSAQIISRTSEDAGRSWGPARVLQPNIGTRNVMSVTLRRLRDRNSFSGPIGLFYLVKNSYSDLQVYLRVSTDEAGSFGEPIRVTRKPGYHVMNNDRVTVLSSGRILV
ncbi:MAG: exo-alpha-sialidase, partial [Planctomycetes bacterium]|nr:exo-alpha-sialidase [Planctomycetota bacterium]